MSMGSGAAEGLQQVLQRLFMEAQQKQQLQMHSERLSEDARQADQDFDLGQGQLSLGGRRVDQEGAELGFRRERAGVDDQRYDAEAPARAADVAHKGALTGELLRKPQAEADDRTFTAGRDKTMHGYRMGEISARSGDSRGADWQIVQSVNPQTNETVSVRVNRQTGEAQPVQMPGGLQPGGAKQTRLSAGQQDDLSTMDTVQQLGKQTMALGEQIGWKGVGGLMAGSRGQFMMKQFGAGDEREEVLRNQIGNIQGTIAKLRGGTAFSAQEKAMLDSYTPTIDDSAPTVKAKLSSLDNFITLKRQSTMKFAGGGPSPADNAAPPKKDSLGIR